MAYKDWDDDRKVMRWFSVGKLEAQSVTNLRQHVDSKVLEKLWEAVKPRGMKIWLSHEVIAKELFNVGYTSATGQWDAWKSECVNAPKDHTLAPRIACVSILLCLPSFLVGEEGQSVELFLLKFEI